MFPRLLFTFATLICLTGLYALYSVAIRPIVVIAVPPEPIHSDTESDETERPAENVRIAKTYIPAHAWAKKSMYMLCAEQAFVYTQSWKQVEDNQKRISFKPFAMCWVTKNKEGEEQ